jgi:hypothetical protein
MHIQRSVHAAPALGVQKQAGPADDSVVRESRQVKAHQCGIVLLIARNDCSTLAVAAVWRVLVEVRVLTPPIAIEPLLQNDGCLAAGRN